jgi:hypothetical protein
MEVKARQHDPIKQVHVRHVERNARRAIAARIGYSAGALISVFRDCGRPGQVIVHVNSGGNARAVEDELTRSGYRVQETEYNPFAPGHYGVQLRVGPRRGATAPAGLPCVANMVSGRGSS